MAASVQFKPNGDTIVVVPCYNEAARLDAAAYDAFLSGEPPVTLLLVDDGSTDDTPLVIERLRQRYPRRVLTMRLGTNVGKAEAVRRGMQLAIRRRASIAGYWDADLAAPLDAIAGLRGVLDARPDVLMVLGSRVAMLGRQIQRRWRRHLLGRIFATAASFVLRIPVYDTQCGAKLFRITPQTTALFRERFESQWIFDVEVLSRFVRLPRGEATIYEYPLERWHEVAGSRLKVKDFGVAAIDLAKIYWRSRRGSVELQPSGGQPVLADVTTNIQYRDAA